MKQLIAPIHIAPMMICTLLAANAQASTVKYLQNFETANTGYSIDTAEFQFTTAAHFLRTTNSPGVAHSNEDGFYMSMLNTEFFGNAPTLTTDSFDITGASSLEFAIDIAAGGPIGAWSDTSNVVFEYQVDAGGWINIFTADNGVSGGPKINGIALDGAFQTITADLTGISGSNMEVRVFWADLKGFENLAIDNMTVAVVPLPTAALAGLGLLAGLGAYRRFRN